MLFGPGVIGIDEPGIENTSPRCLRGISFNLLRKVSVTGTYFNIVGFIPAADIAARVLLFSAILWPV